MRIIQTADPKEMSGTAVLLVLSAILENPRLRVGLATGRTFQDTYAQWVEKCLALGLDYSCLHFFQLDEYIGLASQHPDAMASHLRQQLLAPLGVPSDRCHFLNGDSADLHEECQRYEQLIRLMGGVDLQLLGLGRNGHIAFNEPQTPFYIRTHVTELTESTQAANAPDVQQSHMPQGAITMGLKTIMDARKILLLAAGKSKAQAVKDMLEGPISETCPASLLQFHPDVTVVLDREAASLLNASTTPRFIPEPNLQIYPLSESFWQGRKKILVSAPHPDDAAISCGGTLARLKAEGYELMIACMSTGHRADIPDTTRQERIDIRLREAQGEAAVFGAQCLGLALEFYEREYSPSSVDIARLLALIETYQPNIIFSACEKDRHPAHRASALLIHEAVRQHKKKYGQAPEIWAYEGPWFLFERDEFNIIVELGPEHVQLKRQAIQQHPSQISRKRYDLAAEALAQFRAITTPESRVSAFGSAIQDLGDAIEVFRRIYVM